MPDKDLYDWSFFTAADSASDLLGHMIRWGLTMGIQPRTKFAARALTDIQPLNALQASAVDGANSPGTANRRYWFKARIIGHNSPHSFIPDPCDPAHASDLDYVYKLISMHTSFISLGGANDVSPVTRGDVIRVELNLADDKYQLQYGTYLKLLSIEDPPDNKNAECASLVSLFGKIEHTPLPGLRKTKPMGAQTRYVGGTPHGVEDCTSTGPGIFSPVNLKKAELASLLEPIAPFIKFIAAGESENYDNNGYSAVNKGGQAATITESRAIMQAAFGTSDLRTVSVSKVKTAGKTNKIFAAGRFQIIPATLLDTLRLVPEIKGTDLFNEETQNAIGAALIFLRRPALGNYLLGLHDKICVAEIAGALEWSSLPLPIDYPKGYAVLPASGFGPPQTPWTFDAQGKYRGKVRCLKGQTAYCKGGDAAGHSLGEFEQILKSTRAAVLASTSFAQLKASGQIPTGA